MRLLEALSAEPISIHTPARGVTPMNPPEDDEDDISIHTPARGVTL